MVEIETMLAEAMGALSARELRRTDFPDEVFRNPAWDMLVDLLVNTLEGRSVSASTLAIASGIPATTALRYIGLLEGQGHLSCYLDQTDNRVKNLRLSQTTLEKLSSHFVNVRLSRKRFEDQFSCD